jgi:hypothetical protein
MAATKRKANGQFVKKTKKAKVRKLSGAKTKKKGTATQKLGKRVTKLEHHVKGLRTDVNKLLTHAGIGGKRVAKRKKRA